LFVIWLFAFSVPEGDFQYLAVAVAFLAYRIEWLFWLERPRSEPADDEND